MLGAIIGDVIGSYYEELERIHQSEKKVPRSFEERIKILDKDTKLFTNKSSVTGDSISTVAIYDAIKNGNCNYQEYLKEYGLKSLNKDQDKLDSSFKGWLLGDYHGKSFDNSALARVSPVGYLFDDFYQIKEQSRLATIPTHDNLDAIKASEAVAEAIFLLRNGQTKEKVMSFINDNYYNLNYDLELLQKTNTFSKNVSTTVPLAFYIFSISNDFEDGIRKAISIGGDSSTIASVVGAISESFYEIPEELKEDVKPYLKDYMYDLLKEKYYGEYVYARNSRLFKRKK